MFKTIKLTCMGLVCVLLGIYVLVSSLRNGDELVFSMILSIVAFVLEIIEVNTDPSMFV